MMQRGLEPSPAADPEQGLGVRYESVRALTERICRPLSPEDYVAQSMPDASPAKWHLAHTTWFFETFVLRRLRGHRPYHEGYGALFNSYYEAEGTPYPRAARGLLTRPTVAEITDYRHATDERLLRWLASGNTDREGLALVELGLQHEQQHQELLLTDLTHLWSKNPLAPRYAPDSVPRSVAAERSFLAHPGGLVTIGHESSGFAFDNERPSHEVYLVPFELGAWLVTNGEYLEFMADGGYSRPELWLAEGWEMVQREALCMPLYVRQRDGQWRRFSLHGEVELDLAAPVCQLSYYEADAYARWARARLPTEAEWEALAREDVTGGQFLDLARLLPFNARARHGLLGGAWVWTASAYAPYPGFRPKAGSLGEYNGKFMVSQQVLRGGSCFTPQGHVRPSYRNFFYPSARWQVTGIRLARDNQPPAVPTARRSLS